MTKHVPAQKDVPAQKGPSGRAGADQLARVCVRDADGTMVVSVRGEVDLSNIEHVAAAIHAQPNTGDGLIVDLSEVGYLDSTAVSLLHDLGTRLRQRAQQLVVVSPEGSPPRRVLELTALHLSSPLTESLEEALALIRR